MRSKETSCLLVLCALLAAGCVSSAPTPTGPPALLPTNTPPPSSTPLPTSPPTASAESQALWESVYQEARLFQRLVVTFTLLLEASLNSGQVNPAELAAWLPPRGFTLTARLESPNLLKDGQYVDVVQISPLYSDGPAYNQDVVLVIVEAAPGRYRLISLRDRWFHYAPGEEVLTIVDSNGNGRPEVASLATSWGHASCWSRLALCEWHGDYPVMRTGPTCR